MTAEEYAREIAESDFHFPHPNIQKVIADAFEAGMREAVTNKVSNNETTFIYA